MALTATQVKAAVVGKHSDGDGLILSVRHAKLKQWVLRVQVRGKRREFYLGKFPELSLSEARTKAKLWREQIKSGVDPRIATSGVPTFAELAERYINLHAPTWSNAKHGAQWRSTLKTYANPIIGHIPVDQITGGQMLAVIEPLWHSKHETARRVKQRMTAVMNYAVALELREYTPNISEALPKAPSNRKHHQAIPYQDVPTFVDDLRYAVTDPATKLCLEFAILTAVRSGEARGATWDEIHRDTWVIPASRMKARRDHRVPLSSEALAILDRAAQYRLDEFIFPGRKGALSDMALLSIIRRMPKWMGNTVHGFRSSFHGWAMDQGFDFGLVELSLAHAVGDETVQAYHRNDMLKHRRNIMDAWGKYIYTIKDDK